MDHRRSTLVVLAVVLVVGSALGGDQAAAPRSANSVDEASRTVEEPAAGADDGAFESGVAAERVRSTSLLVEAVRVARAEFETRRDALYAEIANAQGVEARIGLQRRLEHLKLEAEVRILDIQIEHARKNGRDSAVTELERVREAATAWMLASQDPQTESTDDEGRSQ